MADRYRRRIDDTFRSLDATSGSAIHDSAVYEGAVYDSAVYDSAVDDSAVDEGAVDEGAASDSVPRDGHGGTSPLDAGSEHAAAQQNSTFATYSVGEASSRGGDIVVSATDSGLPLAVRVTSEQLRRDPDDLAADLLRLCRLAASRAGLQRRGYLSGLGLSEQTLNRLGLPDRETVERSEIADEAEREYEPRSWLEDADPW
ncbi:hypothetical protein [Nocardia sp. NPDC005366]|uniref:hypothetical protein n=1 Tax=Nocardia sp. NPDC005366 TaxID=3156878 RepID=UPI0033B8C6CE